MTARKQRARLRESVRDYTGGLKAREVPGLIGREARQAYMVLIRERADEPEPTSFFKRFWYRIRTLFFALSYKLSPTRRVLFAVCLILALLSLIPPEAGAYAFPPTAVYGFIGMVILLGLELADRILIRDELEVARELQHELLPTQAPDLEGYEFAFSYRAANTIGGDFYDFLELPDGRLLLVIGDASGHGMAAGLLMAIANATLKLASDLESSPVAIATLVNRALFQTGGRRAFMTLFLGLLSPDDGRFEYACAGHPYPLVRRADGEIRELGSSSLPLGLRHDLELTSQVVTLEPGDLLLLYTDGIPEA
ncbi:MAG: PP2C family protein-serine/threonine phosphatase, partial [Thermoanaerobaculia bacterium]